MQGSAYQASLMSVYYHVEDILCFACRFFAVLYIMHICFIWSSRGRNVGTHQDGSITQDGRESRQSGSGTATQTVE